MDPNDTAVSCAVNIEWLNVQNSIIRKVTHRNGTLRLVRNDMRDMFLEVSTDKSHPVKLLLKGVNVHKKFMAEGKASIKFQETKCTVFISNAPPAQLLVFLRTLFIKMGNRPDPPTPKTLRAQLLNSQPNAFEDISPVTIADMHRAKSQISKTTVTTPSPPASRKRKLLNQGQKAPAAKKLYNSEPLTLGHALNEEQNQVLQACLSGQNVFFTGSAGTGKSFLLRKIIRALPPDVTIATASTGVAACHIGGTTLHSFVGVGGGDASLQRCVELASRGGVAQAWRRCKHLVIDEVSMVDGEYFEKIEAVARQIRRNDKPFGGIQLILCGDFLQLPPVVKTFENGRAVNSTLKRFCFQSPAWEKCIQVSYELQKVHRQKDLEFVRILNHIRIGRVTPEISAKLMSTSKQQIEQNGILATRLCSHMNDANIINESKLRQLPGEEKVFDAQDSDPNSRKQLDQQTPVSGKLILKEGAQVMLLKNINISDGLVNGARGVVIKFSEGLPVIRFKNLQEYIPKPEKFVVKTAGGAVLTRRQVPLRLAWAFSIHKSQGLTLDCVEMSLSKVFEAGQAYVALSRAQSLESLRVLDFDSKQVWANPDVLEFYRNFRRRLQQTTLVPLGAKNIPQARKDIIQKVKKLGKSLNSKPLVNIC